MSPGWVIVVMLPSGMTIHEWIGWSSLTLPSSSIASKNSELEVSVAQARTPTASAGSTVIWTYSVAVDVPFEAMIVKSESVAKYGVPLSRPVVGSSVTPSGRKYSGVISGSSGSAYDGSVYPTEYVTSPLPAVTANERERSWPAVTDSVSGASAVVSSANCTSSVTAFVVAVAVWSGSRPSPSG